MSDAYYFVRLRWQNGSGVAKGFGVSSVLDEAPDLGSGPVHEIQYTPQIDEWRIQRTPEAPKDQRMTLAEVRAANDFLRRLAQ